MIESDLKMPIWNIRRMWIRYVPKNGLVYRAELISNLMQFTTLSFNFNVLLWDFAASTYKALVKRNFQLKKILKWLKVLGNVSKFR